MNELLKLLVNADTAMVGVTFVLCQLIKRVLPSPEPEIPGQKVNKWKTLKELGWVPFAASFIIGTLLSVAFSLDYGQSLPMKIRDGLQTGAYAVAVWELWSNATKLFKD